MALGSVLVDRARIVSKEAASARIEGTTQMATVTSQWFRARLFLPSAGENDGPSGNGYGRTKVISRPQLMWGMRDLDGELIDVHFDHKIHVVSVQLGEAIWQVDGEPEKIRKRRTVIGHLATLERTTEREFDALGV
jgi:hypothetical protein